MRARRTAPGRVVAALLVAGASLGLGGCLDGRIPGEGTDRAYKGASDPAVADLDAEREAALAERFERVQAR